jgi:uncharacterized protein YbdZ (MbtH family)
MMTSSPWVGIRWWPPEWSRGSVRCWVWNCRCGHCSRPPTVAGLARRVVDRGTQRDAFDVLLPLRTRGVRPPFCLHPPGGLSWCYAGLLRHLPADYPLYGLQARGLSQPGWLPATLEELVSEHITHLRSVQPTGPYQLLGWSFGGALAHAIAVGLQHQGESVMLLAMLDSYPIDSPPCTSLPDEHDVLALLLDVFGDTTITVDRSLSVPEVLRILRDANGHGGLLANMEEHHITAFLDIYRNNLTLRPASAVGSFDGALLYFQATQRAPEGAASGDLAVAGDRRHRNSPDPLRAHRHDTAGTPSPHRSNTGRAPGGPQLSAEEVATLITRGNPTVGGTSETYTIAARDDRRTQPGSRTQLGQIRNQTSRNHYCCTRGSYVMTNPFDGLDGTYFALMNDEGQYSLWPAFVDIPAGWSVVHPEDSRQACLDYIDQHWTDMRPRSLIDAMNNHRKDAR